MTESRGDRQRKGTEEVATLSDAPPEPALRVEDPHLGGAIIRYAGPEHCLRGIHEENPALAIHLQTVGCGGSGSVGVHLGHKAHSSARISVGAAASAALVLWISGACCVWADRCGTKARRAARVRRTKPCLALRRLGSASLPSPFHSHLLHLTQPRSRFGSIYVSEPNRARAQRCRVQRRTTPKRSVRDLPPVNPWVMLLPPVRESRLKSTPSMIST